MRKTFLILVLFLTFAACKNSASTEKEKIKAAHWLLGKWETKMPDGTLSENWKKLNDSTYEGQSYFLKGKDTLHFETILLQQTGDELNYIALVQGQNNDKPVRFKFTETDVKQLLFENAKHDYPKKISYTQTDKNNLTIALSGTQQGKPSSEKYSMKKLK